MTARSAPSLEDGFVEQALWCKTMGSPFYAHLAAACANALRAPGPIDDALAPFRGDSHGSVLPLRFLGALHRLALAGEAPELARHYPSCGGDGDAAAAAAVLPGTVARLGTALVDLVRLPVQTNEVSRSAAVLGGFLEVVARTGLPLRVLEIGTSAGLNLRFDRFRYAAGAWRWGDANAEVVLDAHFVVPPPYADVRIDVVERAGCDLAPIDAATPQGLLTLRSYVWADQLDRLALLAAAARVAARVPARIDRMAAAAWLGRELAAARDGVATVVLQTVVAQYLPPDERAAVDETLERACALATPAAPVARLALEMGRVTLRLAPGEPATRIVASASMHGRDVRWGDAAG